MRWPYLWLVACGIWTLQHIASFLVCLPLGCPLGWPAGVSSTLSMGEQPPLVYLVWQTRGPHIVLSMCSRLLGRLPSDETPGVSSLGCALVAVRACLLVLLYCVHPTSFLTLLTPYLPNPTVVPTRVPHFLVYRSSTSEYSA
jgi:hypothetical protein